MQITNIFVPVKGVNFSNFCAQGIRGRINAHRAAMIAETTKGREGRVACKKKTFVRIEKIKISSVKTLSRNQPVCSIVGPI